MSGLALGIAMVGQVVSVAACVLACRHYLKRCKDFADDANDAAHDAYNYVAGLQVSAHADVDTDESDHEQQSDEAEPGDLGRGDDPTLFIPPVRDHYYFREDDPEVLFTHGQQLRASPSTGKHHLADRPHDRHPRHQ